MNRAFAGMGKCALEPYPRTQSQLSVKISDRCNTNYGTMNVVKVENDTDIAAVLESEGLTGLHTGICGMSARTARNKVDMPVDFMYNGPENCINKCLSGEDSVLLCDPQMVSKAIASADFINSNGFGKIDVKMI
jgi:cobalt/nickel transport system ATP-binding protein